MEGKNKLDEKILEEFKDVKKSLEFEVGEPACITVADGHTYVGIFLEEGPNEIYLKDVKILDIKSLSTQPYMKIYRDHICSHIYIKEE